MNHTIARSIAAIIFALFISSCGPKRETPQERAEAFLNAYFNTDFTTAATYCTNELSKDLESATSEIESLDSNLRSFIKESAAKYTTTINEVIHPEKSDTVVVKYTVIEREVTATDTLNNNLINSSLKLIKNREKDWVVAKIGTDRL